MGVAPKYMIIIKKTVVEPDVTLIVMLLWMHGDHGALNVILIATKSKKLHYKRSAHTGILHYLTSNMLPLFTCIAFSRYLLDFQKLVFVMEQHAPFSIERYFYLPAFFFSSESKSESSLSLPLPLLNW